MLLDSMSTLSSTTSGSSLNAMCQYFSKTKTESKIKLSVIDRWSTSLKLVKTFADNIQNVLETFQQSKRKEVILLFSAHSIPQYLMDRGDPYPAEVGATVLLVMEELKWCNPYRLVWQSKVGVVPWLKPGTKETIKDFVKGGYKNIILIPISFVNEHIETLHELDIEYANDLAKQVGADRIARCPTPNDHPVFINGMADLVHTHLQHGPRVNPQLLLRLPKQINPSCGNTIDWLEKISKA